MEDSKTIAPSVQASDEWKFSELEYKRVDYKQFKKQLLGILKRFKAAKTYEEARAVYMEQEQLTKAPFTMNVIAHIRNTLDKTDKFYDEETQYNQKSLAMLMPAEKKLYSALLKTPFRGDFEREFGRQMFVNAELVEKTSSIKIIFDMIEESKLKNEYTKVAAKCKCTFMGEECNFYKLLAYMENPDREIRRQAMVEWAKLYEGVAPALDEIYDKLIKIRVRMAKKLKLKGGYTELAYMNKGRVDYKPADVAKFREQVLKVIVPAVDRMKKEQARRIGVDKLKYYDENFVFPDGNANPIGGEDVLVPIATRMYHELSGETGEFFDFMVKHGLLDLETHAGKHLGGYCTQLADYKAPFIFSNFNGTMADVGVLTHEAGHAFQGYVAARCQTLSANMHSTSEINEIHSMTMEHFTYPWLKDFVGEADAEKAQFAHVVDALGSVPYIVAVDEFQHRVYEKPSMDAKERRAVWSEIEKKYMPWRDYDGIEFLENGGFWMQKQHIFLYPFYYIDYSLAQICAFELYGRMKEDKDRAWEDYLRLCRAAGSKGYFELLEVANLSNPFREGSVEKAVRHVIDEIERNSEKFRA